MGPGFSFSLLQFCSFVTACFLLPQAHAASQSPPFEIKTLAEVLGEEDFSTTGPRRALLQTIPQGNLLVGGGRVSAYKFPTFVTGPTFFNIYGSTSFPGGRMRLTNGPNEVGQALVKVPLRFYNEAKGLAGVFGTTFSFRFSGNSRSDCGLVESKCPGHGFTFTFQKPGIPTGGLGFNLGYGGTTNQSIAVEFDVVQNSVATIADPNANHIGFDSRGSVKSIFTTGTSLPIDLVDSLNAWIEFWPSGTPLQFLLKVYLSPTTTKPLTPVFSSVADPGLILSVVDQDELVVGFTASTGVRFSTIEILSWSFFCSILD